MQQYIGEMQTRLAKRGLGAEARQERAKWRWFSPVRMTKLFLPLAAATLPACGKGQGSSLNYAVINSGAGTTLTLGRGFKSQAADPGGFCVVNSGTAPVGGNLAQQVSFELREVESFHQLSKSLSASAAGGFNSGIYSGSAAASYFESSDFNGYSSYLLVHVKAINSTLVLQGPFHLTDDAKQVIAANPTRSEQAFYDFCGDQFASGKTEGGEFYAVVEFKAESEEKRREVKAKIRGSAGIWSLSGKFEEKMHELSSVAKTDIKMIRIGGSGGLPGAEGYQRDYDGLIGYAAAFPNVVKSEPWTISFTIEDYSTVSDMQIPDPDLILQSENLEHMADTKITLKSMLNRIDYILRNQSEFQGVSTHALGTSRQDLTRQLTKVGEQARQCMKYPFKAKTCDLPETSIPEITWPEWAGGPLTQDRCNYSLALALQKGLISEEEHTFLRERHWAFYFNDGDVNRGVKGSGYCSDDDRADKLLPKLP